MSHKILVTGAGGFIGGYVVEAALERNYETWAGVRTSTSREYLQDNRIQFVNLDFGNSAHLKEQLQELKSKIGRWDYIVHNLGVTKSKNPDDFDRINYGFLRNFVEALTACDMVPDKFVYMSSLGAWGMGDEKKLHAYTSNRHPSSQHTLWTKQIAFRTFSPIGGRISLHCSTTNRCVRPTGERLLPHV